MKKHRISWPPRRKRDRPGPSAAILHHQAPDPATPVPAVRELRQVVTVSAS